MDFNNMLNFVNDILKENNAIKPHKPNQCFRNRYEHSVRVLKWAKRLADDYSDIDYDVLYTACIFHDVGYAYGKDDHATNSVKIFKEYAELFKLDSKFVKKVSDIIIVHSDKSLLKNPFSSHELIIMLEADLMDEEGALGIVWDLFSKGMDNPDSFDDSIKTLYKHSAHILDQDYMITPTAKKIWNEKKELVRDFILQLKEDLFLEGDVSNE